MFEQMSEPKTSNIHTIALADQVLEKKGKLSRMILVKFIVMSVNEAKFPLDPRLQPIPNV